MPGTMRKSKALTARVENYSSLVNLGKNTDKADFYTEVDGNKTPLDDAVLSNIAAGGYHFTQMYGTSAYIGFRSTSGESHMVVKTSKGKLKHFGKLSYFFEYAPVSVVRFGDLKSLSQDGKIWEIKSDRTIGRGWRAGFDTQISSKRTTMFGQVTIGQRPGYRRTYFNVQWGYLLYSYVKKHG